MWIVTMLALAHAEMPEHPPPRLEVTGAGEVWVAPDEAVLTLGVQADGDTADGAFDRAAATMDAVVAAVAGQVTEDRIRTSRLSLEPRYDYTGERARLVGYTAAATLEIRVDAPGDVGAVLDAAVAAGANDVAGVAWVVEDDDAARTAALAAAVADARDAALQVAAELDVTLGAPLDIRVNAESGGGPPVLYERGMAEDSDGAGMPVLSGEQLYRAEVYVSFGIAPVEEDGPAETGARAAPLPIANSAGAPWSPARTASSQ